MFTNRWIIYIKSTAALFLVRTLIRVVLFDAHVDPSAFVQHVVNERTGNALLILPFLTIGITHILYI